MGATVLACGLPTTRQGGYVNSDPQSVTAYLHDQIPITQSLQVTVAQSGTEQIRLDAPLEPNWNHQWTAFGGSISSVAVLACWCLLRLRLDSAGLETQLVIQRSEVDFLRPARAAFQGVAWAPGRKEWGKFDDAIRRKGKGRIRMTSRVECQGEVVATHAGIYVAHVPV